MKKSDSVACCNFTKYPSAEEEEEEQQFSNFKDREFRLAVKNGAVVLQTWRYYICNRLRLLFPVTFGLLYLENIRAQGLKS